MVSRETEKRFIMLMEEKLSGKSVERLVDWYKHESERLSQYAEGTKEYAAAFCIRDSIEKKITRLSGRPVEFFLS